MLRIRLALARGQIDQAVVEASLAFERLTDYVASIDGGSQGYLFLEEARSLRERCALDA